MVWPDRRPKPAMWEHKRLAAPVRISGSPEDLAAGRVELANHQHFSDLGWLRASYSLTVGGDEVAAGAFGLPDLGPGERGTVTLPGWVAPSADQGEAFLTIRITTAADLPWAPAGFEVCALQLPVGAAATAPATAAAASDPTGSVPLDADGRLVHPLLAAAPTLSLWRAPTDNDRIGGMAARWASSASTGSSGDSSASIAPAQATVVRTEFVTGDGIVVQHEAAYTCLADGGIAVEETATLPDELTDLARVGTVLEVVSGSGGPALVRFGTARDVPGSQARRPGRHLAVDRRGPVRPVHPPAGERRPRRRTLARAHRCRRRRPPDRS